MTVYEKRLPPWTEVVGKCQKVMMTEGRIIARISGIDYDVTPRTDVDELLTRLQSLVDRKVGVLISDIPARSVCVRVV